MNKSTISIDIHLDENKVPEQIKKAAECFFNIVKDNIWPQVKKL